MTQDDDDDYGIDAHDETSRAVQANGRVETGGVVAAMAAASA